jgi:hypothetical protein
MRQITPEQINAIIEVVDKLKKGCKEKESNGSY